MKCLITGATGFVGKPLVRSLLQSGHEVAILTRSLPKVREAFGTSVKAFLWNPLTELAPAAAFDGVDVVLHLAGEGVAEKRWSSAQKKMILDSRVLGTRHLVTAINSLANKPKVLVSTSAIGFYGDRAEETLTENSAPGQGGFMVDVCRQWEEEAGKVDPAVRLAIVRVSVVISPDGGALAKMLLPFKAGVGGPIGNGKHWMSWITRDDLIALYEFLAKNEDAKGVFLGASPEPVTNATFTKALAKALKRPAIFPVPTFGLKVLFGEMSQILTDSQRTIPERTLAAGFEFKQVHIAEALKKMVG